MPLISLKYSPNVQGIDFAKIFTKVHAVLAEITDIQSCKSWAECLNNTHVGTGETQHAIVLLQVSLLPGRSTEVKQHIGQQLVNILNQALQPLFSNLGLNCKPSVELRELGAYFS